MLRVLLVGRPGPPRGLARFASVPNSESGDGPKLPRPSSCEPVVPEWARPGGRNGGGSSSAKIEANLAKSLTCQSPAHSMKPKTAKQTYEALVELAKPRLTWLVVLSTMSSYALAPHDLSLAKLALLTAGTALCSASANSINMGREGEFDKLMTRTRRRPLPSGRLNAQQAFTFAAVTGVAGTAALYYGINTTVAALGLGNIVLYGGLYTTLKRKHIVNTWVGAVVGAIPPLMGWGACSSLADPGVWMLVGLLYSWQFPHFMSLSYAIADEYKHAGYVMSAWTDPLLTARVALRHSIAMFPLCFGLSYFGVTDPWFALDSSVVNGWLVYTSYHFWKQQRAISRGQKKNEHSGEDKKYARQLFWASVIHLPAVLVLAMLHKQGRWDWLFGDREPASSSEHQ